MFSPSDAEHRLYIRLVSPGSHIEQSTYQTAKQTESHSDLSKGKLGPLQYKGETTRNELAGATFAARLKCWIVENTGLRFEEHILFLDSRIVQDMIKKDNYGFNTFAGLRVAEIQKKTDVDSWLNIPSAENIADVLTRGAKPDKLGIVDQSGQ